jgi:VanZ family protein
VTRRPGIAGPTPTPRRVPGRQPGIAGRRGPRAGAHGDRWLLAWALLTAILLLVPASLVPDLVGASAPGLDKAVHVLLFLVLGALAVGSARGRLRHPVLAATAVGVAYGAVLELLQAVLGWRSAELADVFADAIGSTLGAVAAQWWGRA